MKKIAVITSFFCASMGLYAQQFQGKAVYESKTSTGDMSARFGGSREITPEMQKQIEERMKRMFEKTFILNFDKTASIYKEEEKIDPTSQGNGGGFRVMASMMGGAGGGTYYKNIKEKTFTVDKEFMGKEFLVNDTLAKLNWKLEGETKKIGDYTCYKATAIVKPSGFDIRAMRPRNNEKPKETNTETKEANGSKTTTTSILSNFETPKETTITAWYTPEIPVSHGPDTYWGLPGLILEVNDGKTTIICSKLVVNSKEKVAIKAPKNGSKVTQKEFDTTIAKKMEEMNQTGGRNGGFQIRMAR